MAPYMRGLDELPTLKADVVAALERSKSRPKEPDIPAD
jgi:hypothetical protein